jgi:hypothetical protein
MLYEWYGETKNDGTYGDGNNSFVITSGAYIYMRYCQLEFNFTV